MAALLLRFCLVEIYTDQKTSAILAIRSGGLVCASRSSLICTSQKTRFDYVITSLSPEVVTEVRDLILKPPEGTPYSVLKEELIKQTAASEQRRLQKLFNAEEQAIPATAPHATTTQRQSWHLRELFLQRLLPLALPQVSRSCQSSDC